jgi:hypothetical protein
MPIGPALRKQDADILYERYVKPMEESHRGEYVAVSLEGQTILAPTLLEAVQRAADALGKGNSIVFKVGDRSVGKLG